jgi:MFS family permease
VSRNPLLLCAYQALSMALFPVAIFTLFWRNELGLDMTQLMGLQALFAAAVAAFEFPCGYLADRIGYRRTLIVASLFAFAGWSLYALARGFGEALVAEILLAASLSLVSGTDLAMLYESLRAADREPEFGRWAGRHHMAGQIAEATAALVAGLAFAWWTRLPFVLQIGIALAEGFVAFALVEPPRPVEPMRTARERLRDILAIATRRGPLRAILALAVLLSLSSFIPVWLIQLYAQDAGVPVAWLGPIWAAANLFVALGAWASTRVGAALGLMPTLALCIALIATGYAGLGLSTAVFGFAFYFCLTFMRGLWFPVLHHEEQRLIPSSDRAALLSLRSFGFRCAFAVVGPLVGAAVDARGQRPVLLGVGALISVACIAAWAWLSAVRRSGRWSDSGWAGPANAAG